jgi:hypothetical protein
VRIVKPETYQEGKSRQTSTIRTTSPYLCLLLLFGFNFPTQASDLPHEFTAHYKLTKGIITLGKSRRSFKNTGPNEYMFESISKPYGVGKIISNGEIHERSNWILHQGALRPVSYSYQNSDSDLKRNVKLLFDWEKLIVVNNINGDPWKMKLELGTQDKLLYLLSLMSDLKKGKRHLEYRVADGGSTKTYRGIIEGEQNITTDLGTFSTLKIVREHHNGKRTILWCAPSLDYLPIQIEQIKKDGSSVRASLYNLEGMPIQGRLQK